QSPARLRPGSASTPFQYRLAVRAPRSRASASLRLAVAGGSERDLVALAEHAVLPVLRMRAHVTYPVANLQGGFPRGALLDLGRVEFINGEVPGCSFAACVHHLVAVAGTHARNLEEAGDVLLVVDAVEIVFVARRDVHLSQENVGR